ncbi:transport and Golgi organization protein 1 homolog [Caerostris darwini]|uniref:Transport and Golgi organization protein 1 homolog n=1 Tax=Caerostris darwini TaxID=1538125 RepID=A0AAV4TQ58_9ARAC|nr:transport and Golgi organization protein 1 homolog [Caerostris darwini]
MSSKLAEEAYYGMCADHTCSKPLGLGIALIRYSPPEHDRLRLLPNQEFDIYVRNYGEKKNLFGIMLNGQKGYVPFNAVQERRSYIKDLVPAAIDFVYNQGANPNQMASQVHVSVSSQEVIHHGSHDTYSSEQSFQPNSESSNHYSETHWPNENSHSYGTPHVHIISSQIDATLTSQSSNAAQQPNVWDTTSHAHQVTDGSIPSSYTANVQHSTTHQVIPEQQYLQSTYGSEAHNVLQTSFSSQIQSNSFQSPNYYSNNIQAHSRDIGVQNYADHPQSDASFSSQVAEVQYSSDATSIPPQHLQESPSYQYTSSHSSKNTMSEIDISHTIAALKSQGYDDNGVILYLQTLNIYPSFLYSNAKVQNTDYGQDYQFSSQSGYLVSEKDMHYTSNLDSSMSSLPISSKEKNSDYHANTHIEEASKIPLQEQSLSGGSLEQISDKSEENEIDDDEDEVSILEITINDSEEINTSHEDESSSEQIVTSKPDEINLDSEKKDDSIFQELQQSSDAQESVGQTVSTQNVLSTETVTNSEETAELIQNTISHNSDLDTNIFTSDEPLSEILSDEESLMPDSVDDISSNTNSIKLASNNTSTEKENIATNTTADASLDILTDDYAKSSDFSFDNVESKLSHEIMNETDILLDYEQDADLEKMLNTSEIREAEGSDYSNAYQIRNLKGEQDNKEGPSVDSSDEMGENASYSEFDFYASFENGVEAIRSFIEVLLLWIPEPLYSVIMELETKGISPRVPVFTTLCAIPCLFLIVTLVYIKETSKEKKLIAQLAFAEKNVYTLSAEKSVLEEKLEKVEAELKSSTATLNTERKFYEDLKAEVVSLNQSLEKTNLELDYKKEEIEALKEREKEFVELIADHEKAHLELVEEKNRLVDELNNQEETVAQFTKQLQEKENELKKFQGEKLQYVKANEVYEEKLAQLQQNCNQLLKEAEIWNIRVNELNSKLNEESQLKLELEESVNSKQNEVESLSFLVESFKSFEELGDIDGDEKKSKEEKLQCLLNSANISIKLQNREEENEIVMQKLAEEKNRILDMEVELLEAKSEIDKLKLNYNRALQDKTEAQTKLDVLTNYFKDKEIQLQKQLGAQEVFREKREKDADSAERRICLIEQENISYKSQVASMKQEMEETERNLKSQIAAQEKKAHENWITARAAERKLEDMKQEVTQLRQKLTLVEREQGNFMNTSRDDILRPIPQRIAGMNDETINSQDINNSLDEPPSMYRMPLPPLLLPEMPRDRPLPPLPIPPPPPMFGPPPFGHFPPPHDPMFNSEFRVTPPEFARGRASTPPRGRQSAVTDSEMVVRQSSPMGNEMRESRNSTPPHSLPDFHDIPPPPRPFYPPHRFPFRPPFRREFAQGPRPDYQEHLGRGTQPSSQDNWASSNSRV